MVGGLRRFRVIQTLYQARIETVKCHWIQSPKKMVVPEAMLTKTRSAAVRPKLLRSVNSNKAEDPLELGHKGMYNLYYDYVYLICWYPNDTRVKIVTQ